MLIGLLTLICLFISFLLTEKPTYDASGSSPLQGDLAATAAPAHPLADLSVAGEVPFSVVHSDGDSESEGEGLSGQPAFSSVLTVMAGTVKHPVSLDQSRTSPTITRDETHTTQWPSQSSSQGSEMSSSSSSTGDRSLPVSSGLTSNISDQHTTPPQAVSMASAHYGRSHVSLMDENRDISSFSSSTASSSSLSSSVSPSALPTSSVLSSIVSLFSPPSYTGWINKAASSPQSQRILSSPISQTQTNTLSPAGSRGWTDSLTNTQSTTHSAVDLSAISQRLQSTTAKPSHIPNETSIKKSNKVTTHSLHPAVDKIHGVSETHISSESTKVIKTPATSTYISYSSTNYGQNLLKFLYRPTQAQNQGWISISANNLEISTSFPTTQESRSAQMQQGDLQNPTSALLSAHPKGYSVSSHVTQQMLNQTAYAEKKSKTAFVQKSTGDSIMSPLSSHGVNSTASVSFFTVSSQTPSGETSLSKTAITELTPIHSGMPSSEHASNPGDLLMAAGHGSPTAPAINIKYNQGEIAQAELQSVSAQAHLNYSLSLTQPRPESTTGSILSSITRTGKISSRSESDPLHLQGDRFINIQEFVSQTESPKGVTQEPTGGFIAKMTFPSNSRSAYLSGSVLPVQLATHKTMYQSLSHPTQPTHLSPWFLSRSSNHNNTDHDTGLSANSEVKFADQTKTSSQMTSSQRPFQHKSTLRFLRFFTTSGPPPPTSKSHQTATSAKISAHIIKSERVSYGISSSLVETVGGNSDTSPASDIHVTHGKKPPESFHRNAAKVSVSPPFDQNEESTTIRDTAFNNEGVPTGKFMTQFLSFVPKKDFSVLNRDSESSVKGSPTEIPSSPLPSDAALETLKSPSHEDDVTLMGHYEQTTPSSWSEIILTRRRNSTPRPLGSLTSVRSDKSNFYLGIKTTIPSTASSAVTTSSSDGLNSSGTFSAIFSFGTNIMAPYTKWKTTKPVSFQGTASELESTSIGFDRAKSNLQADGTSYEHPKLDGGQEHNVRVLNLTDPTEVANELYSIHPSIGEHSFFTYVKRTSGDKKQGLLLSPVNPRSAVAVSVQQGAAVNTAAPPPRGSDGFLPFSHITTDSVTSSQVTSPAFVYKSEHSAPLADVDSLNTAVTLISNPALSFSDSNIIHTTTDLKLRGLDIPTELLPSSSLFHSSPSSLETSPPSYSNIKASISMSSKASSPSLSTSSSPLHFGTTSSIKPTIHPSAASPSVSQKALPATFSSSSPNLTFLVHLDEVIETSVVLTEMGTDEFTAGTSRADALNVPKEKVASLAPSQSVRITLSAGATERTSQVSPLPPRQDTTTASDKLTTTTVASTTKTINPTTTSPSPSVITGTTQSTTTSTTLQPTPVTRRTTPTTTIRTHTGRRTFTPPVPRTSPPRGGTSIYVSPFTTTTTEAPPQQCNITERLWVKTGKQHICHSAGTKQNVMISLTCFVWSLSW